MSKVLFAEDAKYIVEKVLEVHPDIYWKNTKEDFEDSKNVFLKTAPNSKTTYDFWLKAKQFMASLKDAHTNMLPLREAGKFAPITLEWVAGQIVIKNVMDKKKSSFNQIRRGDILLFIDGTEVGRYMHERLKITPANYFDHGIISALETLMAFPENKKSVELTLAKKDGSIYSCKVLLQDKSNADYVKWNMVIQRNHFSSVINYRLLKEYKAAYLQYRECLDRSVPFFVRKATEVGLEAKEVPLMKEVCQELFHDIYKNDYKFLIIDLRNNGGGASVIGNNIYQYLTQNPIKTYGSTTKLSLSAKNYLSKNLKSYPKDFALKVQKYLDKPLNYIYEEPSTMLEYPYGVNHITSPQLPQFAGEVIVLTNAGTFSSGEWLAVELKDNGLATFVGEPTGGGGTVPGDTLNFKTPNLNLEFYVSYKLFRRPNKSAEKFPTVMPDYFVSPAINDYHQNVDTVLEWVKDYIAKKI